LCIIRMIDFPLTDHRTKGRPHKCDAQSQQADEQNSTRGIRSIKKTSLIFPFIFPPTKNYLSRIS
jgi:hypothetical protein